MDSFGADSYVRLETKKSGTFSCNQVDECLATALIPSWTRRENGKWSAGSTISPAIFVTLISTAPGK